MIAAPFFEIHAAWLAWRFPRRARAPPREPHVAGAGRRLRRDHGRRRALVGRLRRGLIARSGAARRQGLGDRRRARRCRITRCSASRYVPADGCASSGATCTARKLALERSVMLAREGRSRARPGQHGRTRSRLALGRTVSGRKSGVVDCTCLLAARGRQPALGPAGRAGRTDRARRRRSRASRGDHADARALAAAPPARGAPRARRRTSRTRRWLCSSPAIR